MEKGNPNLTVAVNGGGVASALASPEAPPHPSSYEGILRMLEEVSHVVHPPK